MEFVSSIYYLHVSNGTLLPTCIDLKICQYYGNRKTFKYDGMLLMKKVAIKICRIFHLNFLRDEIIYQKTKVSDKTQFFSIEHTFYLTVVAMFITCQNTCDVISLDTENPRESIVTNLRNSLGGNVSTKAKKILRKTFD